MLLILFLSLQKKKLLFEELFGEIFVLSILL